MSSAESRLAEALAGHYAIEREVGAGGMATVYLARDVKHDRQVALKVLRPELSAALGSERFPREIKFVAQFNHPHILSLYDSGEAQGFLYYVMPYVEGESLRDRLLREKQLPIADAVRILKGVADALAYSHARGVVHRDIKPGNVLLSGRHAVVTDFGVAKAVSASASSDTMTTVGMAVGTPHYMAPEQAMGQGEIDQRADIYALGILAYEMLTGRTPFSAETAQGILAAHVMEAPKPIRELRPAVPEPLADVIMKCLAKNPADRWQSADEFLAQLDLIAATPSGGMTPTHTRPVPGVAGAVAGRRMSPLVWAGLAVVVIGAAAGIWLATRGGGGNGKIQRIGVMPIEDISGKDSVFVAAMQDALTNSLSRLGKLGVASRSEMMRYKGSPKTDKEIASELKLDAVVEATVFRAGDVMRINVQFSNPVTTRSLWASTYNPNVSNVLAAQDSVVGQIQRGIDSVLVGTKAGGSRP
ncbi:MAG: protein kinase domain-containing protein [Gemmatimonadales bacterium]